MGLPLLLVEGVQHLEAADLAELPVQVQAALPEVAGAGSGVGTELLPAPGTAPGRRLLLQAAADRLQVRVRLPLLARAGLAGARHGPGGTGSTGTLLLLAGAAQICRDKGTAQPPAPPFSPNFLFFPWDLISEPFLLANCRDFPKLPTEKFKCSIYSGVLWSQLKVTESLRKTPPGSSSLADRV